LPVVPAAPVVPALPVIPAVPSVDPGPICAHPIEERRHTPAALSQIPALRFFIC
jgi:hypothetical protein